MIVVFYPELIKQSWFMFGNFKGKKRLEEDIANFPYLVWVDFIHSQIC